MTDDNDICLKINVLGSDGAPFRGEVDIELDHQTLSDHKRVDGADASSTIAISGLHRFPQGLYQLTVTPSREFKPNSRFVRIPPSGALVVAVRLDAPGTVSKDPILLRLERLRAETTRLFAGATDGIFTGGFGHYDDPHGDSSPGHLDFGHLDSAHIDFLHADGYSDAAHDDLVHDDSGHDDGGHADGGHDDGGHDDGGHDDGGHDDGGHDDGGHDDGGHDDGGHDDGGHDDGGHDDGGHGDDGDRIFVYFNEVIDEIILLQGDFIDSVSSRFTNLSREFSRTVSELQSRIDSLETEVQELRK